MLSKQLCYAAAADGGDSVGRDSRDDGGGGGGDSDGGLTNCQKQAHMINTGMLGRLRTGKKMYWEGSDEYQGMFLWVQVWNIYLALEDTSKILRKMTSFYGMAVLCMFLFSPSQSSKVLNQKIL